VVRVRLPVHPGLDLLLGQGGGVDTDFVQAPFIEVIRTGEIG